MHPRLPQIVTLASETTTHTAYDNHPIASVNDHVVRIATMTAPYDWHTHPNSDETFLILEGQLLIEFESGTRQLNPGQMLTIPRGTPHCTSPIGKRSVNLTIEAANCETIAIESPKKKAANPAA